jgi:hypothetical protein
MRNRVKSFFPASLLAVCILAETAASGQTPQPQTPPPATTTGATGATTRTVPNVPDDTFNSWAFGVNYWLTSGPSDLLPGKQSTDPIAQFLKLPGADKRALGAILVAPAGKYNRIEISGFQARGSGTSTAPTDVTYFGQAYSMGDLLQSSYRLRNIKVSYNYLTYPAPPTSKFRFKTLYEFQYVSSKVSVSAPLDLNSLPASATRSIFLPTLGVGTDIVANDNLHLEIKGSGMAFPGKSLILDGEAHIVARLKGIEIVGGAKFFRYRTSPNKDEFVQGRLFGPEVGIRYVFGRK